MNSFFYKKVLIFGGLLTSISFILLTLLEIDSYSFFENLFALGSDQGIASSLFAIGILLIALAYILKMFKKG